MIPKAIESTKDRIEEVCRKYRVRELSVFGSALRGDFNAESDVDFLVEFEADAPIGFLTLSRLRQELSAIIRRPVDVVPKQGLKPKIRQSVLAEAERFYAA